MGFLPLAKDILRKAKEIDEITHGQRKVNFEKNWKHKGQTDLGAEEGEEDDGAEEERGGELLLSKEQKFRLRQLNEELKKLLAQPFLPRGMSTRYPTKSGDVLKMLSEAPDALRDLRVRAEKLAKPAAKEPAQKKRKKKAFFYKPK